MNDELIYTIINGGKPARMQAKEDAIAVYGDAKGRRLWKAAKKAAKQYIDEGGDYDAYYDQLRTIATDGLRSSVVSALKEVRAAAEHLDELRHGTAVHIGYEDTPTGADVVHHLNLAATALRTVRDLHARVQIIDRVNATDAELEQCPATNGQCRHGQPWPCQVTRASWALHGKDAFDEVRAANGGAS